MPAGEQADQHPLDHQVLADDDALDLEQRALEQRGCPVDRGTCSARSTGPRRSQATSGRLVLGAVPARGFVLDDCHPVGVRPAVSRRRPSRRARRPSLPAPHGAAREGKPGVEGQRRRARDLAGRGGGGSVCLLVIASVLSVRSEAPLHQAERENGEKPTENRAKARGAAVTGRGYRDGMRVLIVEDEPAWPGPCRSACRGRGTRPTWPRAAPRPRQARRLGVRPRCCWT